MEEIKITFETTKKREWFSNMLLELMKDEREFWGRCIVSIWNEDKEICITLD